VDYKDTLNLPKTSFPMKANLVKKEPEILSYWAEIDIYRYLREMRKGRKKFVLHDGPPYANGRIHLGTAMNKILKDFVIRYKAMRGYDAPYIPGWDTHGLPIEHKVTTAEIPKEELKKMTKAEIRKRCSEYALRFVKLQKEDFMRLGVVGDWENPYLTLDPKYEADVLRVFKTLVENGQVYRSRKPIYWCPHCKTALAEAEVEYRDHTSPSIYVKFKMIDSPNTYVIIWTTTPWTLVANVAIALHPDEYYVEVSVGDEIWIMAEKLMEEVMKVAGIDEYKVVAKNRGNHYEGMKAKHPFIDRESVIILADYVTMDTGTGCVHTAPGHGEEDYLSGLKYGLSILSPVDDEGKFTEEAGKYAGMFVHDADKVIVEDLKNLGVLVASGEITHSYPHCWRCRNPVIFRATDQWFIGLDRGGLRQKVLDEIERVEWIPSWGKNRIGSMIADRPDWCISRQRVWGIPIPAFKCEECGERILDPDLIERVIGVVEKEGTDAWFEKDATYFLPEGYRCPKCGSSNLEKEEDILDVWIDSGSSFEAVLRRIEDLSYPCDMYLEGSDQHRGWFNSSIILSVAQHGIAPYKSVLTHGFIKDEEKKKMSKSLGNVIDPQNVVGKFGADVLRLWVAGSDFTDDITISMKILEQQVEVYRKIRNTFRFMLGNLYDFDPEKDAIRYEELEEMDRWIISKFHNFIKTATKVCDDYQFYRLYHMVNRFITVELSSLYLDVIKDRLYVEAKDSKKRRSAQTALHEITVNLSKMLAPFIPFTMEELYMHFNEKDRKYKTIAAEEWPSYDESKIDRKLEEKWEMILKIRDDVMKAVEKARNEDVIGHSLDSKITIKAKRDDVHEMLKNDRDMLMDVFIVSQMEILDESSEVDDGFVEGDLTYVKAVHADGVKCPRCWKYTTEPIDGLCPRCHSVMKEMGKI